MNKENESKEAIYSTEEVAKRLKVGPTTIRKYSLHLENQGYVFSKTIRKARQFKEKDIEVLKKMIKIRNSNNVTVEQAASRILNEETKEPHILLHKQQPSVEHIQKLLKQQNQLLNEILQRIDDYEQYVHTRLNERDKELLKEFNDRLEKQRELAATTETETTDEKHGLIYKLFKAKS